MRARPGGPAVRIRARPAPASRACVRNSSVAAGNAAFQCSQAATWRMASRSRCCGCWRCGGPITHRGRRSSGNHAGENLRSDRIKPGSPELLLFLGHHILIFSSARIASARVTISLGSATSVLDAEGAACPTGRRALPGIAGAAAAQAQGCASGTAPGLGRLGS
jgi:hypothetical protein